MFILHIKLPHKKKSKPLGSISAYCCLSQAFYLENAYMPFILNHQVLMLLPTYCYYFETTSDFYY